MAADPALLERVRELLVAADAHEKAMFGGVGFLVAGHMAAAVGEDGLLLRVDPDAEWITSDPRAGDAMPGRPMRAWRTLAVTADTEDLPALLAHALDQVRALPPKG